MTKQVVAGFQLFNLVFPSSVATRLLEFQAVARRVINQGIIFHLYPEAVLDIRREIPPNRVVISRMHGHEVESVGQHFVGHDDGFLGGMTEHET